MEKFFSGNFNFNHKNIVVLKFHLVKYFSFEIQLKTNFY
jgi:hypothetical protein